MKKQTITVTIALLMLVGAMLFSTGCNTWEGLGKDVEDTGEAIQGE